MHWYRDAACLGWARFSHRKKEVRNHLHFGGVLTWVSSFYFLPLSRIWRVWLVSRAMAAGFQFLLRLWNETDWLSVLLGTSETSVIGQLGALNIEIFENHFQPNFLLFLLLLLPSLLTERSAKSTQLCSNLCYMLSKFQICTFNDLEVWRGNNRDEKFPSIEVSQGTSIQRTHNW